MQDYFSSSVTIEQRFALRPSWIFGPGRKGEFARKMRNEERTKEEGPRERNFARVGHAGGYRYSCRRWSVSRGPCQWRSLDASSVSPETKRTSRSRTSRPEQYAPSKSFENLEKSLKVASCSISHKETILFKILFNISRMPRRRLSFVGVALRSCRWCRYRCYCVNRSQ